MKPLAHHSGLVMRGVWPRRMPYLPGLVTRTLRA
ncbi:putative Threonine--tRNA ligase gene leader peptide [Deinococcus deserti VCD115]|uniref:Putative Threonine--tRNA ligase gene leader peptide n=1 Tax=Deinococcus deserti (strain DSM 17065 / CIP 109153 / LMG 22923 / VCD115) TaxID=546414 RepID=X5HLC1_DEIDV|nr:putative Threonine--tRNA ligase gene leader peptide [Deinococcus deserti VCD115]